MLKKIFFFLVFLATVYLRNISSAHQLSEKITFDKMAITTNEIPDRPGYEIALLSDFKNMADNNSLEETGLTLALQQGHATHIP